ncbi:MAG: hypothetical protein Q4G46_01760 [Propionibacteriaceae bacterium]|nr:hypothetical protein [Propionibacteriaceae bacterium]
MSDIDPLKIGLVAESRFGPSEIRDFLDWTRDRSDLLVTHVIVVANNAPAAKAPVRMARSLFALLTSLEARALQRRPEFARHADSVDLTTGGHRVVTVDMTEHGSAELARDLAGVDVLVRLVPTTALRSGLATGVRHGVLQLDLGDGTGPAVGPPGFTEVLHRAPTTSFTVSQHGPQGVRVIRTGSHATYPSYAANRAGITQLAMHHLQEALTTLARSGDLPTIAAGTPQLAVAAPATPSVVRQLRYGFNRARAMATGRLRRRLGKEGTWSVGFQNVSWQHVDFAGATEIENPADTFLADPFVFEHEGQQYCFVEEYPFATARGIISVYRLSEDGAERLGVALDESFHLSFPNVFRHDGEIYMCPETMGANEIRLYRCTTFPLQWELAATLMPNVDACDTLLFPHADKWWMLTNIDPSGQQRPGAELHVFSAPTLLTQDWTPHPQNPVVTDAQAARNGGILRDGDDIYRVSQRIGFTTYGAGSTIRKITRLDDEVYAEVVVRNIDPDFMPGICGTHHLHSNGQWTVFDYLR